MKRLITDTLFAVLVVGMSAGRVSGATLLHYDFSGTGTTVSNLAGDDYDGTLEGFTTEGAGLNGAGQVVFVDRTATITTGLPQPLLAGDFTVDVIFTYTGPETGWYMLVGCSQTPHSPAQIFQIGKRGGTSYSRELYIQIAGVLGTQTFVPLEDVDVFDGQQHRLVVTYSQTEALLRVFVDGSDTPAWSVAAGTGHVGTQNILIGNAGHANESWIGSIDAVAISNECLDPSQFVLNQGAATNPTPPNNATGVAVTTGLSWEAPNPELLKDPNNASLLGYEVFFGTDELDLDSLGTFDQTAVEFVDELLHGTTYYWRVDVIEPNEPEPIVYPGRVWSFTTVSLKAANPSPANGAEGVAQNAVLSWDAGPGAVAHDVYFGTDADLVFAGDASVDFGRQSETDFAPDMDWQTQYFWRVDEVFEDDSLVMGDVWSFTTTGTRICADPLLGGDVNNDCVVNLEDVMLLVQNWMVCNLTNGVCP